MAGDIYGLQPDVNGQYGMQPADGAADALKAVREEMTRLSEEQGRTLIRTRETRKLEREKLEAIQKETEAVRANIAATRSMREEAARTQATIATVGGIITDLFGGRFISAVTRSASAVSSALLRGPAEPPEAPRPATQGDRPRRAAEWALDAKTGRSTAPEGGKGQATLLAGLGAGLGVAGAAVQAFAGAAKQAHSTMIGFAAAASPGAITALNSAFELVSAKIGTAFMPYIPKIGAALLMMADEIGGLIKAMGLVSDSGRTYTQRTDDLVDSMGNLAKVVNPLIGLFSSLSDTLGKMLYRLSSGKSAEETDAAMKKAGIDPNNVGFSMLRNMILHQQLGGPELQGKKDKIDTKANKYERNFIESALMKSGQGAPRFEATEEAYRRIQQASAGITPIEQEQLNTQIAMFDYLQGMLPKLLPKPQGPGAVPGT